MLLSDLALIIIIISRVSDCKGSQVYLCVGSIKREKYT